MKRAILTGASDGLGFEISRCLIERGFEVIGLSRNKPDNNDVVHIKTDLTDDDSIKSAIQKIREGYKEFDLLINCAGVLNIVPIEKLDSSDTGDLFKVNVISPMILVSGLIDLVRKNEADIVNVGSTMGFKAYEKQAAYTGSKWAMRGFTKNLQVELKNTPCRVIGFNPGGFKSRLFEKATGKEMNLDGFMEAKDIANFLMKIIDLPKNMEVSEVIINRK